MLNGDFVSDAAIVAYCDRGLMYGDGVFETLHFGADPVPHCTLLSYHWARLRRGLHTLKIAVDLAEIEGQLKRYLQQAKLAEACSIKITVTRGSAKAGYAPDSKAVATIVISAAVTSPVPPALYDEGVTVRLCEMRMGRNPALAGIKHLNRLEQVMARSEWQDAGIFEGLLRDSEGLLVEATAANVFLRRNGELLTPDLRYCGVAGTQREHLLDTVLPALNLSCRVRSVTLHDLYEADEVFLASSRLGVMPVTRCGDQRWPVGELTCKILAAQNLSHV